MARISNSIYEWKPTKGKGKKSLMKLYEATVECRDTLFDIKVCNKS